MANKRKPKKVEPSKEDLFWEELDSPNPHVTGVWLGVLSFLHEGKKQKFVTVCTTKHKMLNNLYALCIQVKPELEKCTTKVTAIKTFIENDKDNIDFIITAAPIE